MNKLLFTDLYGTLISPSLDISEYYFEPFDKEISLLCRCFNAFFSQGHFICIVTEASGHDSCDFIISNILLKIHCTISPVFRKNIFYF